MKPKKWNTTVTQYKSTKSNISIVSPFFSLIACSLLIHINLSLLPPHFPIPKLVEIHELLKGIWYIPSTPVLVAAQTSFSFFNSSSVAEPLGSHGAVPESDEYKNVHIVLSLNQPNKGKAQFFNTFTTPVLTIRISKRISCLLLASLKKYLKWQEFCKKGYMEKNFDTFDPLALNDP